MDSWLQDCGDRDPSLVATLLSGAVSLLPPPLARLPRRRCAFLSECLAPASAAARAVEELLPPAPRPSGASAGAGGGSGDEDIELRELLGKQWGVFFGFASAAEDEVRARL
jgi:hypothetical protein